MITKHCVGGPMTLLSMQNILYINLSQDHVFEASDIEYIKDRMYGEDYQAFLEMSYKIEKEKTYSRLKSYLEELELSDAQMAKESKEVCSG